MQAPTNKTYVVTLSRHVPYQTLMDYWSDMAAADTLKYRFSDIKNVTPHKVMDFVHDDSYMMFSVVDVNTQKIISEFAFENFTGKAAQVHFSMHPENDSRFSVQLATEVTDDVLNVWKTKENPDEPFLDTIYGLTPVDNRAASIFIRKAGFEKIGILPRGIKYMGEVTDALLTVKTRIN